MCTVKVLLVDDFEGFRHSLRAFLRSQPGFEVVGEAVDGNDAIEKAEQLHPDLVLMDLEMPNKDGFDATREIKRRSPETRVVILSMHNSDVYRRAAREFRADDFIDKNSMKYALTAVLMNEQARRTTLAVNAA
ncbi:MAG: response regulator transcription factor [Ignavibacteriales bacterium]|nr:response regulator transcription factor [Ignavibacteriales bacterium]